MSAADGRWHVTLACGHTWLETRPDVLPDPENGEYRVCHAQEHYPNKYQATYLDPDVMEGAHRIGLELIDATNQWATLPAEQHAEAFAWLVGRQTQTILDILKLIPDDKQVALVADLIVKMREKIGV